MYDAVVTVVIMYLPLYKYSDIPPQIPGFHRANFKQYLCYK